MRTNIFGDLVYKLKIIVGNPNFSDQFKNIIKPYINLNIHITEYHATDCMPEGL